MLPRLVLRIGRYVVQARSRYDVRTERLSVADECASVIDWALSGRGIVFGSPARDQDYNFLYSKLLGPNFIQSLNSVRSSYYLPLSGNNGMYW